MEAKQKAKELVDKFYPFVNGYIGSSMLTNTEYPEAIIRNAKKGARIVVEEIIFVLNDEYQDIISYWEEVKVEIDNIES